MNGRFPVRRSLLAAAIGVLLLTTTGCAPRDLGFELDDTIKLGTPSARGHTSWGGIDLENTSGAPIVLKKLTLTGLSNATISHLRIA